MIAPPLGHHHFDQARPLAGSGAKLTDVRARNEVSIVYFADDLGLREAAALLAMKTPTATDVTAVVAATLTLWVINLFIPSMIGLVWQSNAKRRSNSLRANFGA